MRGLGALPLLRATLLLAALRGPGAAAQELVSAIPPLTGLTVLSALHSPDGDREDVVELTSVDSTGVTYQWHLLEFRRAGDTIAQSFTRRVRANDLAGAPRVDPIFASTDEPERPGYTAFSIASAVFKEVRDKGSAAYTMTALATAGGFFAALGGGDAKQRARFKGTLARAGSGTEPFPLLIDGRRVQVPAMRLRGTFANGLQRRTYDFWVLADSAYPLILKSVSGQAAFQVVRVNYPAEAPAAATGERDVTGALERELRSTCRLELPGVYFAFNTATIDPASDRALAAVARLLSRHRDWRMTVEGHTDSVGTAQANQALSERRAEAVRARLANRHGVDTRGWRAVGFGFSRPREPNATIEGRARNRRVELVRDCGA